MTVVVDASVALRWFVDQPGHDVAAAWLRRFATDPELFVAPDLLHLEVYGGLARLQPPREPGWAIGCFQRLERLGIRTLPTTLPLFERGLALSRELRIGGYDALYLAHAEDLGIPWLTADVRVLRRLKDDPRIRPLVGAAEE
jgi:predicted nucleic acid-binding protein